MNTDQIFHKIELLNRTLDNPILPLEAVDRILSNLERLYAQIEGY